MIYRHSRIRRVSVRVIWPVNTEVRSEIEALGAVHTFSFHVVRSMLITRPTVAASASTPAAMALEALRRTYSWA